MKPSSSHNPDSRLPPAPLLPTKAPGALEMVSHFRGQTKPDINRPMHLHEDGVRLTVGEVLFLVVPQIQSFPKPLTSPNGSHDISFPFPSRTYFFLNPELQRILLTPCFLFSSCSLLFILSRLGLGHPELVAVECTGGLGFRRAAWTGHCPARPGSGLLHCVIYRQEALSCFRRVNL